MAEFYKFYFEKLDVWKNASHLYYSIHSITKKFPKEELFGLTNQLRRASSSVALNLAEGSSRSSRNDQSRFTAISFASLMEVVNLLIFCQKINLIDEEMYSDLRQKIEVIARQLNALKKAQKS